MTVLPSSHTYLRFGCRSEQCGQTHRDQISWQGQWQVWFFWHLPLVKLPQEADSEMEVSMPKVYEGALSISIYGGREQSRIGQKAEQGCLQCHLRPQRTLRKLWNWNGPELKQGDQASSVRARALLSGEQFPGRWTARLSARPVSGGISHSVLKAHQNIR